ncbi:MAG: cytochrome b/b6 domain-containing protein [Aquabacterium sp.]
MTAATSPTMAVRVWDLPTRLFHWALVLAVIGLVITGKVGGNALVWHMRLGYVVFALLGFRIVWGLVGGHWSRFASFVHGPGTVLRYLRGAARPGEHLDVGHNPLGAGSVLAMLLILALQVASGLVVDDEIAVTGPLNKFVSSAMAGQATAWHKGPGQWLIFALVGLHVAAILFYRFKRREDLVTPMLRGDKQLEPGTPAARDDTRSRLTAALLLALWAIAVWLVVRLGG